ncbi:drug efflux membrane protein [Mycobacterium lentiflavum]|uniref:Drug efflux membrane protein n=1 Tax=Mycobacterium lentiflavum TaxID=141349 RepID=A0A0E3WCB8_MYCLN|nr:MFS transporter [Mycobacterium lentiflavum]MEE3063000.1 MFS transporter [Actinomycetota bacterium]ULP44611.1 MFS transporter [Mycobacterium lentiflavum]CQD13452.1 drug efflux membrane protein [Mycobacterium lentiflavum]
MTVTKDETGSWRELLGEHLGMSTVLAGGVLLYSTNEFLTVSMLPSIIADIGGARLFSWATTLYLIGSVVSASAVHPILQRIGARRAYLLGLSVFALASVVNALAPSMAVLVAGRALRGVSGGLLAGLGYALINTTLPRSLWTRGSALVSAMWGVSTLIGPVAGGIFAQLGLWRWGHTATGIGAVLMVVLVRRVMEPGHVVHNPVTPVRKVPIWSLLLMSSAALTVSVAALPHQLMQNLGLLLAAVLLVFVFVVVDRRLPVAVLPRSVFGPGPAKWIFIVMSVEMAAAMANIYVPLFGQKLADLSPVESGFLAAALATGWTGSEIVSASLTDRRVIRRFVVAGPLVMAAGLALAAVTQRAYAPLGFVALWALALLITGAGIGVAWPHLVVRAMDSDDPEQSSAAAAAINTVQLVSAAFGGGLAGVVVNLAEADDAVAARTLYLVFAVLAGSGVVASYRAARDER